MSDCSPLLTPMSPGLVLTKKMGALSPEDVAYMKDVPYLSCIGSLQYLASMTRSDIAQVVAYLAHFNLQGGRFPAPHPSVLWT